MFTEPKKRGMEAGAIASDKHFFLVSLPTRAFSTLQICQHTHVHVLFSTFSRFPAKPQKSPQKFFFFYNERQDDSQVCVRRSTRAQPRPPPETVQDLQVLRGERWHNSPGASTPVGGAKGNQCSTARGECGSEGGECPACRTGCHKQHHDQ